MSRLFVALFILCQSLKNTQAQTSSKWVQLQLKSMSTREKIGQMIMPWMEGGFKNFHGPEFQRLKLAVTKDKVGGFIVFRGNPNSVSLLTNELQNLSKIPLFFAADYEYGLPTQTASAGTSFPTNMGLGATYNPHHAFISGKIIAQESKAIGINWIFAPVADVNNNPDNPVINTRSFGENPHQVGLFSTAFSKGIQSEGAIATLKHFPGHGDTSVDSHVDLPTIAAHSERIETVELLPFKMGIEGGVKSIMVAHVTVPSLGGSHLPATLNPKLNKDLLRDKLGFNGLIITDAMEMGAVVKNFSEDNSIVSSILAGADIVLVPLDYEKAILSVEEAVKGGKLSLSRINESVERILFEKYRLNLHHRKRINPLLVNSLVQKPENVKIANSIADQSTTLLRNDDELYPIDFPKNKEDAAEIGFILLSSDPLGPELPSMESVKTKGRDINLVSLDGPSYFKLEIWKRLIEPSLEGKIKIIQLDRRSSPQDYKKAIEEMKTVKKVIVASFVKRAAGKGSMAIPEEQISFLKKLHDNTEKKMAVMAFGSPYQIRQFPFIKNYAVSYGLDRLSVSAGARALFGEIPFNGKLPVRIPELFPIGSGLLTKEKRLP